MDPYKVLGISPNASDEQVKQAYRTLAKKYHPDNYVNNPIADLAAEKMKEINSAYDTIMNMRHSSESSSSAYAGSSQSYSTGAGSNPSYAVIRNNISYGNLDKAEELLTQINDRNGEWYFLMGSIYYRRGWMDQARECFRQANSMEPGNPEYAAAYNRMAAQRDVYRARGDNYGASSPCDCCSSLICADCCCESLGGDLISCC